MSCTTVRPITSAAAATVQRAPLQRELRSRRVTIVGSIEWRLNHCVLDAHGIVPRGGGGLRLAAGACAIRLLLQLAPATERAFRSEQRVTRVASRELPYSSSERACRVALRAYTPHSVRAGGGGGLPPARQAARPSLSLSSRGVAPHSLRRPPRIAGRLLASIRLLRARHTRLGVG